MVHKTEMLASKRTRRQVVMMILMNSVKNLKRKTEVDISVTRTSSETMKKMNLNSLKVPIPNLPEVVEKEEVEVVAAASSILSMRVIILLYDREACLKMLCIIFIGI